jgi:hypothetical protein
LHNLGIYAPPTQNSCINPKIRLTGNTLIGKRTKSCLLVAKKPNLATDFAGVEIPIEDPITVAVAASIYTTLQNPKTLLLDSIKNPLKQKKK